MAFKRSFAMAAVAGLMLGGLAACSDGSDGAESGDGGSVYFLNWKPEQDAAYQEIAKKYTEETGVPVKVTTAASGTYEQTLRSEITKSEAPTLFQINGPVGLKSWQDYALDLTDSELAGLLSDQNLALKGEDGATYGLPVAIEGYGIIYNDAIMRAYFETDGAVVSSMDEVNNFDTLKAVTDDMQAKADELGIAGVFASTSLAPGEEWRWQTHLSNIPVFYEYRDDDVTDKQEIEFTYNENFKNIFDLYLTNSTVEPSLTPSKTVTDSMAEFATGQAAMVQNGNWAWSQIAEVQGNTVAEEDIKFLPIYTGVDGEEKQGLAVGTEAFMAINSQASDEDQQATIDFVNWLFTSDEGKQYVLNDLGYQAPYTSFGEDEVPSDPLAKEIQRYLGNEDLYAVSWVFTTYPSQAFKDEFAQALGQYAAGNIEWSEATQIFVDAWAAEKQ